MKRFKDLSNLKANCARVAVLDRQIPQLQALAEKLLNDVSIPVSACGDPAGFIRATGGHSDPTQRAALADLPADVRQLLTDIRAMTIERHRTAARIQMAESALDFLPAHERVIVELRVLENLSWFNVVDALYDRTGETINEKTARARYDRACAKMEPFFNADAGTDSDGYFCPSMV